MKSLLVINKTLHLPTFNLPPGVSCPGKSAWCAKRGCIVDGQPTRGRGYCHRGHFGCPLTVAALQERLDAVHRPDFEPRMRLELKMAALNDYPAVRLHSCGDFYSLVYLRKWVSIAKGSPIPIFAFTKSWRVSAAWRSWLKQAEEESAKRLILWWSGDPSTEDPQKLGAKRVALVKPKDSEEATAYNPKDANCLKQTQHLSCVECGRCWDRRARRVTFMGH